MNVLARHDYLTRNVLQDSLADWVGPEQTGAQRRHAIARASDALEQHVNDALPAGVRWMPSIGAICGPTGDRLPSGADGTFASWFRERLDEVPLAEHHPPARHVQPAGTAPSPHLRPAPTRVSAGPGGVRPPDAAERQHQRACAAEPHQHDPEAATTPRQRNRVPLARDEITGSPP